VIQGESCSSAPVSTSSAILGQSSCQPSSARPLARSPSVSEGCTSAPPLPQTHTLSTGYGQFFSKLMAKFSSPDSMADREWARAEREAARKGRERAARRKRQAVLLRRVRALEVERDAYHSAGVEFPHEELLAQARANARAAGAYGPWDGHGHSGDGSLVGANDALPPYTPATGVQADAFCGDSQRGQPSQEAQFHDTRAHNGVVQAHTADTRADRRGAPIGCIRRGRCARRRTCRQVFCALAEVVIVALTVSMRGLQACFCHDL
jgi:hypothetical protein